MLDNRWLPEQSQDLRLGPLLRSLLATDWLAPDDPR
jgi:hypothetical protein